MRDGRTARIARSGCRDRIALSATYADWEVERLRRVLRGPGVALDCGAVRVRVRSFAPGLAGAMRAVYGAFETESPDGLFDVTVTVRPVCGVRALLRPQIELVADGVRVFEPFAACTHLPLLEWGLNYLVATRANHRLLLHAGTVERAGVGVLLPALPGSGKSTLTAALACRGYRLLSDEFGVVDLRDGSLWPLVRPVGLKNESIDLIARLAPGVRMGPRFEGTHKGTVAHLAPERRSVRARRVPATPAVIVFPQFERGAPARLEDIDAARAFCKLSVNAFNYRLLGRAGFDAVLRLVQRCRVKKLVFGRLDDAAALVDRFVDETRAPLSRTGT